MISAAHTPVNKPIRKHSKLKKLGRTGSFREKIECLEPIMERKKKWANENIEEVSSSSNEIMQEINYGTMRTFKEG